MKKEKTLFHDNPKSKELFSIQVAIFLPKIAPGYLPMLILGSCSILGAMLSLLLPETLGVLLPETIEDMETFKHNDKKFFECWTKTKLNTRIEALELAKKRNI